MGVVFDINRLCCVLLTLSCLLVRSVLCFIYNFLFWVYSYFAFSVFLTVVFSVLGASSTSIASLPAATSRRSSSSPAPLLLSGLA